MEAGHSEAVLVRHYRELVTPAAAAEFWSVGNPKGSEPNPGRISSANLNPL